MLNIKKVLVFSLIATTLVILLQSCSEEERKAKRREPPATATQTITNGNTITINYSKPSLKGRTLGKDVARFDSVWQTGANEATTFEITKDAKIEGKDLKKGKYSLYTIPGKKTWTIIFNKTWDQWGVEYRQAADVLKVQVAPAQSPDFVEMMKFIIEKGGKVFLFWGDTVVSFQVS